MRTDIRGDTIIHEVVGHGSETTFKWVTILLILFIKDCFILSFSSVYSTGGTNIPRIFE